MTTAGVQVATEPFWVTYCVTGANITVYSEWDRGEDGMLYLRVFAERNDR